MTGLGPGSPRSAARPGGLGRGLGALIPHATADGPGLRSLPLDRIDPNPRQPRDRFDEQGLVELAASIREVGLLQPVLVRPAVDGRYELVAGERRLRAARLAGLTELPALVRRTADDRLLTEALVENLHRTNLDPLEEAAAYRQLLDDLGMTHDGLAARLGRSRSAISNALRLLGLPATVQHLLRTGALSAGHARALLALPSPVRQERVAQRVVDEELSVRATEALVREPGAAPIDGEAAARELARAAASRTSSPYASVQDRLEDLLATRVRIRGTARRGRVVIDYAGEQDLDRLLSILSRGSGQDLSGG